MNFLKTLFTFLLFNLCAVYSLDILVKTKNGNVQGRKAQTVGQNLTYFAYQGIPYAEPPIGDLRFEPPVAKKSWTGVLDVTKDGSMCVQNPAIKGSEDCLFINVYVPEIKNNSKPMATMVFIHGGGFQAGSGRYEEFGPDYLLGKEVVVVTLNYRLGIYGFLTTGDTKYPGNNGLKDQVLALKWVKDNIATFGGDPNQVTIFGQSAGSASVAYHLHSPLSRGLFHGAIMQSGVSICSWALSRNIPKVLKAIGSELKIFDNVDRNLSEIVKKLKTVKYTDMIKLTLIPELGKYGIFDDPRFGFAFGPVIEPQHKNAFFTQKAHQALVQGDFTKVPSIVGYNSLEATFPYGFIKLYFLKYDTNHTRLLPPDLNIKEEKKKEAAEKIKKRYFGDGLIALATDAKLAQYLSDDVMVRPIREFVHQVRKHASVYFYEFSYEGDIGDSSQPGVAHGEENQYLWRSNKHASHQDLITRDRLLSFWTHFAKTGNPTPPEYSDATGITWKKSDENYTYLDIGYGVTLKQFPHKSNMDFWDQFFRDYANPPLTTY